MLTIVRRIPMEEYFMELRAAPLEKVLTGEKIFVYKNAHMELRSVWPDEINPSTLYLLEENLERQYALREFLLKEHGIDTLNLSECILFVPDGEDPEKPMMLIPPFVEVAEELVTFPQRLDSLGCERPVRSKVSELVDGAHRMYMARQINEKCRVVWVVGAASWDHPLYVYPNHWEEIGIYNDMKEVPLKKLYRRENALRYTRMRPLRAGLGNTGAYGR